MVSQVASTGALMGLGGHPETTSTAESESCVTLTLTGRRCNGLISKSFVLQR